MPLYIVPKDLSSYLATKVKDLSQLAAIADRLKQKMADGTRLTKKHGRNKCFHTVNLNTNGLAHRAVFELVKMNGVPHYVLRDFVWAHHYDQALRWKPLATTVTEADLSHLFPDGIQIIVPQSDAAIPDGDGDEDRHEDNAPSPVYYQGDYLLLTPTQQAFMSSATFPALLVGPPGSGKTLLAVQMMQEQALAHYDAKRSGALKLLYVTENAQLVQQLEEQWKDFAKCHFEPGYRGVIASFLTINQYLEWYASLHGKTMNEGCLSSYKADEQAELVHHAYRLHQDLNSKKNYDKSAYQAAGARNTLFSEEKRAKLYPRFCDTLTKLEQSDLFSPQISMMTHEPQFQNDMVFVDEAQKVTPAFLIGMLRASKHSRVLIIGDSFQKGQEQFSSLSILGAYVWMESKVTLSEHHLTTTLRLKPDVARAANAMVLLYTNLNAGKVDAVSYATINITPPSPDELPSLYMLHPLQVHLHKQELQNEFQKNPSEYKAKRKKERDTEPNSEQKTQQKNLLSVGEDANAAAIILREEDRASAQLLIESSSVFTPNAARGLEFSQTVLYLSKEALKPFEQIAALMRAKGISAETALAILENQSPNKDEKPPALKHLSDLIVASSRTHGQHYVYIETPDDTHALTPFYPWLTRTFGVATASADVVVTNVQCIPKDWLNRIHQFIKNGALQQAIGALREHFELTEKEAASYLKLHQSTNPMSVEDLMVWRDKIRDNTTSTKQPTRPPVIKGSASNAPAAAPPPPPPKKSPPDSTSEAPAAPPAENPSQSFFSPGQPPSADKTQHATSNTSAMSAEMAQKIVDHLKDNFTHEQWAKSIQYLQSKDPSFWFSPPATDLMVHIVQSEPSQKIVVAYYANLTFGEKDNDTGLGYIIDYCYTSLEDLRTIHEIRFVIKIDLTRRNQLKNLPYPLTPSQLLAPIHWAAAKNNDKMISTLHTLGVNLNKPSVEGHTAAHIAVGHDHQQVVKQLHILGADLKQVQVDGKTPAFVAAELGNTEMLKVMYGLDPGILDYSSDIVGPTFAATVYKKYDTMRYLHQIKMSFLNGKNSAVHHIVRAGDTNTLKVLKTLDVDLNFVSDDGATPLHAAVLSNKIACVRFLLKAKVDTRIKMSLSKPQLMAVYSGDDDKQRVVSSNILVFSVNNERHTVNEPLLLCPEQMADILGMGEILGLLQAHHAQLDKPERMRPS
jgi:ankyrin repeat protein